MAYIKQNWINGETIATAERMKHIEDGIYNIYNDIFPIGRGFIDFTNTDFSNYLGFTWERTLVGMTPVGIDSNDVDFNTIGKTGGEKTHTLTLQEMPKHTHDLAKYWATEEGGNAAMGSNATGKSAINSNGIGNIGNSQPHNNLQPYITCYMFKRTA